MPTAAFFGCELMKLFRSLNCVPKFGLTELSIRMASCSRPFSPWAATHPVTFSRVLPVYTSTSSFATGGGGVYFGPRTVTTVVIGTVGGLICPRPQAGGVVQRTVVRISELASR